MAQMTGVDYRMGRASGGEGLLTRGAVFGIGTSWCVGG
jgi:hypothetical protein